MNDGIEYAGRLINEALKNQFIPIVLETLLVRGQMQAARGDDRAARADIATAIEMGQPEGFITLFLEEGEPVAKILVSLLKDQQLVSVQADYAQKVLATYPEAVQAVAISAPKTGDAVDALIEPLSKRELEILRLIGEGLTNQEIAERLVITLHTVKKHSSNIYGKLGVRSRTQAVARARELQLL